MSEHSSPGNDDGEDIKTVYVKRWRTLVKLPAKYADEIVEALRVPAQQTWQLIETAPRDGKFILVFYKEGSPQDTVAWDDDRFQWSNGHDDRPCYPTHWKQLDAGPAFSSTERHCEFCHVPMSSADCCDSEFESKGCPHSSPESKST